MEIVFLALPNQGITEALRLRVLFLAVSPSTPHRSSRDMSSFPGGQQRMLLVP